MKVLAYPRNDGGLSIVIPAPGFSLQDALAHPDVQADMQMHAPAGEPQVLEEFALPQDRMFRNAWKLDGTVCMECPVKSKEIAHNIRRAKREEEFAPLDKVVSLQLPGKEEAETKRQGVRDKYAAVQEQIDAAATADELRNILREL